MENQGGVWSPRKRKAAATPSGSNSSGSQSNDCKRWRLARESATPSREKTRAEMQIEQEIEHECRIRDGATKLLQVSKNSRQSMETAKSLLASNARVLSLMAKLQKTRTDSMLSEKGKIESSEVNEPFPPCKAKLIISDIRIPLEVKGVKEHIKGTHKTDQSYCSVFCLFKLDGQIKETEGLIDISKNTTDISFPDSVTFSDVGHDFKLHVELYCSPIVDRKGQKKASSSDPPSSPALSTFPQFTIVGHSHLTLGDVSDNVQTHNITTGVVGASPSASCNSSCVPLTSQLSLWGQFCCLLRVQPNCATGARLTGFTNVQRMVGDFPAWTRYWCVFRQNYIRCWVSPEDIGRKTAVHSIRITEDMTVSNAPRLTMRRPNTLLLSSILKKTEHFLSLESKEEKSQWQDTLHQTLSDIQTWKEWCSRVTPVSPAQPWRQSSRSHLTASPAVISVSPAPKIHTRIIEHSVSSPLVEMPDKDPVETTETSPMKKRRAPPPPKTSPPRRSNPDENQAPSGGEGMDSDSPVSTPVSAKKRRAPLPPTDQLPHGKTRESTEHYYTAL